MKVLDIRHWILDIDLTFVIRHLKLLFLLLIFINVTSISYANITGYSSLQIIPTARECAMGGSGVVSGLGPQSMYFNPALTSNISLFAVNVNYTKWLLDMYEQSLFLVRPFKDFNLGLGIVNFNAGKLDFRPDYPTDEPIADFNPVDFNVLVNFSKKTETEKFQTRFGISAHYYFQKIYEYVATGIGVDIGTTIKLPMNFQIGAAIKDFGTEMEFIREDFKLPTRLVGGVVYKINLSHITMQDCFDINYLFNDKEINFNIGTELNYNNLFFARGGYRINKSSNSFNVGFGVLVRNLRVEYALSPNNLGLGNAHHISIGLGY